MCNINLSICNIYTTCKFVLERRDDLYASLVKTYELTLTIEIRTKIITVSGIPD